MNVRSRLAGTLCLVATTIGWGAIPVFLKNLTMTRADYLAIQAAEESLSAGGEAAEGSGTELREVANLRHTKLDPWTLNALRYTISALFWLPFLTAARRKHLVVNESGRDGVVVRRNLWRDAILPTCMNTISQASYGVAFLYISASTIGFTLRMTIIPTILFSYFLLSEERGLLRHPGFWIGTLLCFVGLVGVFRDEILQVNGVGNDWLPGGIALGLTLIFWSAYSVVVQKKTKCYPAIPSFAVISQYTAVAMVLGALLFGNPVSIRELSGSCWMEIIASAFIGIAIGHVLYFYAISSLGSVVATSVLMLAPFVTKGFAMIFLHEPLGWLGFAGGMVLLFGGFTIMAVQSRTEKTAVPDDIGG